MIIFHFKHLKYIFYKVDGGGLRLFIMCILYRGGGKLSSKHTYTNGTYSQSTKYIYTH